MITFKMAAPTERDFLILNANPLQKGSFYIKTTVTFLVLFALFSLNAFAQDYTQFSLPNDADLTLTIYDATGVLVRQFDLADQPAGFYTDRGRAAYWDGRNQQGETVANGVYFCTLTAGDITATRKMLVGK